MTTLLIDADMLLFRTMAANEIEANLGDEVWVRWAELGTVREEFWKTIDEWLEVWHGADYRLCWTGRVLSASGSPWITRPIDPPCSSRLATR